MPVFTISLPSIDAVKNFVHQASALPCDVDVRSGRYLVNAKSIMGLFSIDLSEPVEVEVHGTQEQTDALQSALSL